MNTNTKWPSTAVLVGCALLASASLSACKSTNDDQGSGSKMAQPASAPRPTTASNKPMTSKSGADATATKTADKTASDKVAKSTDTNAASLSSNERKFLQEAIECGSFEVESARIAVQKNISVQQRQFAQMVIDDHGKCSAELRELALKKGVSLASSVTADDQKKLDDLRALEGKEFEVKFHELQAKAHDQAIECFEKAARDGSDADVRAFATRTLPTLREHRKELDELPTKA